MASIICLANSYRKKDGRCVAGIDLATGMWVRPVLGKNAAGEDIPIPVSLATIGAQEIRPLDVVQIPLIGDYREDRYQRENRRLGNGPWSREGRVEVGDILQYCEEPGLVLFNRGKAVKASVLEEKAPSEWQSLLLIRRGTSFFNEEGKGQHGELKTKHRARFEDGRGNELTIAVTDPDICARLDDAGDFTGVFLLTVSLTTPFPEARDLDEQWCYKVVAAAIALE